MSPEPTPRRAIRIVSQCQTKDDFIAVFHPYFERDGLFVATASPEEAGARLHFVMTLAGGEAVLRGAGVVIESHRSKSNFYGLRGMKLRFDELDSESRSALRAVEAGPRRHTSAPAAPGRSPNEMVECLIYEDPGTESREPVVSADDVTGTSEASDPGNLMPLTVDDDVTAVAPPPRRPGEDGEKSDGEEKPGVPTVIGPAPNGPRGPGFVVPRPRSDPAIAINPRGERVELNTDKNPPLRPAEQEAAAPAPVPAPPRLPSADEGARVRRGKPTGPPATGEAPPMQVPQSGQPSDIAELATMRLPAADARRGIQVPERYRHESSPPDYRGGDFTPPPGDHFTPPPVDPMSVMGQRPMVRQPGAPRRPMVPAATITPTEIVSPIALGARTERRRSRSPMASERTDVVRVSYVRTAAVSATLGALLGLGAGYLLWGLDREVQPGVIVPADAGASVPAPPPHVPTESPPATFADAGPGQGADAAPAPPRPTPAKKPAPPPRRRVRR